MKEATYMNLQEAIKLGDILTGEMQPFCERVMVAGSVRRRRPEVNDIDIVAIPKTNMERFVEGWFKGPIHLVSADAIWESMIKNLIDTFHAVVERKGPKLVTLKVAGTSVDIYRATPETWGVLLLIRTGSAQHNMKLCSRALNMGLQLSAAEGVLADGRVIASRTEEEIFRALNMAYVPPEERGESHRNV